MKVAHVISSISDQSAGPSYSVPALCEELHRKGAEVEIHTLSPVPEFVQRLQCKVVDYRRIQILPALCLSRGFKIGIRNYANTGDIIHTHGLWQMPGIYGAWATNGSQRCKLILSPRGMFSTWALSHSSTKKRVMWVLAQRAAFHAASCIHATAENEYEEVRASGFRSPVAIIPNGIELPLIGVKKINKAKRLLFLARIHPKKGVDILLKAWDRISREFSDWELVIAGPDNVGHLGDMQALAAYLQLPRVRFVGAVFGEAKSELFFSSTLYVLPTHSENFGMTVAEALAHGLPCVVTRGAPWAGLESHGCGWWINLDVDTLAETLRVAMSTDAGELLEMGSRGRDWMGRDFSWEAVGQKMIETYDWLLRGGMRPSFVFAY